MSVTTAKALVFTCSDDCDRRAVRIVLDPDNEDALFESVLDQGWSFSDAHALCEIHSGHSAMFQGSLVPLAEKPGDRCYWTIPGQECDHWALDPSRCTIKLYDADEDCRHRIEGAQGGGVKCVKCFGWFCA